MGNKYTPDLGDGSGANPSILPVRPAAVQPPARSPYSFSNFTTRSKSVKLTGAQVNALGGNCTFPVMRKVATIDLQTTAGLIAVNLASSLTNFGATPLALFVAIDQGDNVSVDGISKLFISHLSDANSVAGLPSPATRSSSMSMGQNSYFKVGTGERIALYASAPNDAATLLTGVLTVSWINA